MGHKKILLADDSEVILRILSKKLKSCGYEVFTALDGAGLVGVIRRERIDLLILDINFPPNPNAVTWSGFDMIQWLQQQPQTSGIPAILISADNPMEHKDRAVAAGVVAILHKPVNENDLIAIIRETLGEDPLPPKK